MARGGSTRLGQIPNFDRFKASLTLSNVKKTSLAKVYYKAYADIKLEIENRRRENGIKDPLQFVVNDTLCRQVSGREPQLKKFSAQHDVIVFVSGTKSSNGKMLYDSCKVENPNSHFISDIDEIKKEWFSSANSVGICGATSTPLWLMENVSEFISEIK